MKDFQDLIDDKNLKKLADANEKQMKEFQNLQNLARQTN